MSSITDKEKSRRSSKKMYEQVDELLLEMIEDQEFSKDVFRDWAKNDPKGFMMIMKDRLPKVQPVDQDLKKTLISLKSMMEDLPDVEDIAKKLRVTTHAKNKLENENIQLKEQIKLYQKKLNKKK